MVQIMLARSTRQRQSGRDEAAQPNGIFLLSGASRLEGRAKGHSLYTSH